MAIVTFLFVTQYSRCLLFERQVLSSYRLDLLLHLQQPVRVPISCQPITPLMEAPFCTEISFLPFTVFSTLTSIILVNLVFRRRPHIFPFRIFGVGVLQTCTGVAETQVLVGPSDVEHDVTIPIPHKSSKYCSTFVPDRAFEVPSCGASPTSLGWDSECCLYCLF